MSAVEWSAFAAQAPDLASAGERLFQSFTLGYLATVGDDGYPRIAPLTLTRHGGGLYAFVIASTPKARDLAANPRFALHAFPHAPTADSFDDEEFALRGEAVPVDDEETVRALAQPIEATGRSRR
jgi:general stress protein 26